MNTFVPIGGQTSFNFNIKNNLLNIHHICIINGYINDMLQMYNKKRYIALACQLERVHNKDIAFVDSISKYNEILTIFNKIILVKHRIKIYISKKRAISRPWTETNDRDLSLNKFKPDQIIYTHKDNVNKTIQKFTLDEIDKIFRFSIYNNDTYYSYPLPETPRNPYTNNIFSIKDLVLMYNFLLEEYSKKKKCMSEYVVMYKNSCFDITILHKRYLSYLNYHSAHEFIENLSDNRFLVRLINFINMYLQVRKTSCIKCIKSLYKYREVFTPVLVLSELNTNGVYEYGDSLILYNKLQKEYNLHFGKNHDISHRSRLRGRRNIRRTISYEPLTIAPIRVDNGLPGDIDELVEQASNMQIDLSQVPINIPTDNHDASNVPIAMIVENHHLIETVSETLTGVVSNILSALRF